MSAATPTARSLPASPRVQAKNEANGLAKGLAGLVFKSSGQLHHQDAAQDSNKKPLLSAAGRRIVIVPAATATLKKPATPPAADGSAGSAGSASDLKKAVSAPAEPPSPAPGARRPASVPQGVSALQGVGSDGVAGVAPRKHRQPPRNESPLALSRSPSSDGTRTPPNRVPALAATPTPTATPAPALKAQVDTWTPGSGHRFRSMRCLREDALSPTSWPSMQLPGVGPPGLHGHADGHGALGALAAHPLLSDAASVRSLASIGMGSTDGRKLTIRRVPTSPSELLNYSMNGTRM